MTAPCLILTALATSGLRPNTDQPLELGLLAVDRRTFEMVDLLTIVMHADPSSFLVSLDPFVADMHAGNGLLEDLVEALPAKYASFDDAARAAASAGCDFIEANGATGECRSPLICFGVDFTHRWLKTRFSGLPGQFFGELDMTTVLRVQGRQRPKGTGRAEDTLMQLHETLKGLRP